MKPAHNNHDSHVAAACPGCGNADTSTFYQVDGVPAHSVLLMPTRAAAVEYPTGQVALALCARCGLISNGAFDTKLHEYSERYEETQGFSPTFNSFHERLARQLIERYDLRDKDIVEIGCGKGEFLSLLCRDGMNRGVGFDPAYIEERRPDGTDDSLEFVADFYSEKYAHHSADLICCKMTLEHIDRVHEFISTIRRSVGDRTDTVVFFQVPDATRIFEDVAFWDIYYEHCSYFTAGSLSRLFRSCGFEVLDVGTDYDGQYLMIEARPGNGIELNGIDVAGVADTARTVEKFCGAYPTVLADWRSRLDQAHRAGQRTVIWGGGSKGVSFLTTLAVTDEVQYAVDINPYKHGTFMAGTGHEIISPDALRRVDPDLVIVMNPIYRNEIASELASMGLTPDLVTV